MNMEITQKDLNKIKNLSYSISHKTGVPQDELFSECLGKIPNVLRNFNPVVGKPFEPYLMLSMRGYALNYVRDKSFLSSISRADLTLYLKSKKFPNLQMASDSLQVPLEKLESIHVAVRQLRSYNSLSTDNEWQLDAVTPKAHLGYTLSEIISDEEFDIVYTNFVLGKFREPERALAIVAHLTEHKDLLLDALKQV